MPTILRGSTKAEKFILGKSGVAFGSNDPGNDQYWNGDGEQDDDTVIIGLDPKKDTIFLAGTKEDYLIRPTSLPFSVEGYPGGTGALAIILTDRNNRIMRSGEGNELTTIGWLLPPLAGNGPFSFAGEIGLTRDPSDYDNRGYYTDNTGKILIFEGGAVPARSSQGGFIEQIDSFNNSSPGTAITISNSSKEVSESGATAFEISTTFGSGTKLYYKTVGKGVNKNDFASGNVKGAISVQSDGFARIPFVIKADNLTEGTESFSIQAFSDKKMRVLAGQSDAVSILDTSIKSVKAKPTKKTKGTSKDPVTGLTWEIEGVGTFINDKYYDSQSDIIRRLRSQGSELTGIEFEMSQDLLIINRVYANSNGGTDYERGAYSGKFEYSNGRLSRLTVNSFGLYKAEQVAGGMPKYESVEVTNFPAPQVYQVPSNSNIENGGLPRAVEAKKLNGVITGGNFNDIYSFGGGRVFSESWWLNPNNSNLI